MIGRIAGVAVILGAILVVCIAPAGAGRAQPDDVDALLAEIEEMHARAQVEFGFAMFLEGLQGFTISHPEIGGDWTWTEGAELSRLNREYAATALVVEPALAYHLDGEDGKRRDPKTMRESIDFARDSLRSLPEQRRRLARLVLEHVFGEDDLHMLAEIEKGGAVSRGAPNEAP